MIWKIMSERGGELIDIVDGDSAQEAWMDFFGSEEFEYDVVLVAPDGVTWARDNAGSQWAPKEK